MKKSLLFIAFTTLLALSFQLSSFAQTFGKAEPKIKPENCVYFQLEVNNETHEFVYLGYNSATGHQKWLEMGPGLYVQAYDHVSSDEWSMFFKSEDGVDIQNDLNNLIAKAAGVEVKLKKARDNYERYNLGGQYLNSSTN